VDGRPGFARPEAEAWIREALGEQVTLWLAVRRRGPAFTLQGRAPIMGAESPAGGHWVVRRYWRGGVMRFLADRHLRLGEPRPVVEARASEALRARGIPTPPVVGAAIYPAGVFYRADLVTEFVPETVDLGTLLFAPEGPWHTEPELRLEGLMEAGRLVGRLAGAGGRHPDLNASNLLLRLEEGSPAAVVIDLDRCLVAEGAVPVEPLLARLERSVGKVAETMSAPFPREAWGLLHAGAKGS